MKIAIFIMLITTSILSADCYITPHIGVGYLQNTDEKLQIPLGNAGSSDRREAHATFNPGYVLGVSIGYQCHCYCLELDYNHTYNDVYRISTDQIATTDQNYYLYQGYMQADILTLNGFYSLKKCCLLTPYIGGGAGAARLETEQILASAFFDGTAVDDNTIRFAYHLRAGLKYCLAQCLIIHFYYGFYDIVKSEMRDTFDNSFHLNYHLHTVNFGLSYGF